MNNTNWRVNFLHGKSVDVSAGCIADALILAKAERIKAALRYDDIVSITDLDTHETFPVE